MMHTTISILVDRPAEVAVLTVTIDGEDHDLGEYPTVSALGAAMGKWLADRGLTTALGSGRRLQDALDRGGDVVTFDVVRCDVNVND